MNKEREGLIDKAIRFNDYVDYGTVAFGAMTGSVGLVAGGLLGMVASESYKALRKPKNNR